MHDVLRALLLVVLPGYLDGNPPQHRPYQVSTAGQNNTAIQSQAVLCFFKLFYLWE